MKKKQGLRFLLLLIGGGVVGAVSAFLILTLMENGNVDIISILVNFITTNFIAITAVLFVVMFIPAVILVAKGRKEIAQYSDSDEDDLEDYDKKINLGLMLNSIFIFVMFILFGSLNLDVLVESTSTVMVFVNIAAALIAIVCGSVLEVISVNIIQKNDPRIKGDPTKFSFTQEYFESCDEGEREKIALASFKTFVFNKNFLMLLMILAIFYNIFSYNGFIAVVLIGLANLGNILSYYYNVQKKSKKVN